MSTNSNNSLTKLVEQYTENLYSWAVHKVSDTELAKDLVQDTFLAAAEKIENFKGDSTHKTWLFSILNHKIIDFYRKKVNQPLVKDNDIYSNFFDSGGDWKKEERPQDWDEKEGHLLDNSDFQEVLQKCLKNLPEKWEFIIKSKYLLNKKGDKICQELEITSTNYWQIIHRAKLQLRECVNINWFKE